MYSNRLLDALVVVDGKIILVLALVVALLTLDAIVRSPR